MREMHAASVQGVIDVPATCAGGRAGLTEGFVCACPTAGRDEGGDGGLVGGAVQVPNDDPVTANGAGFFDKRTEEVPTGSSVGSVAVDGREMEIRSASAGKSDGADATAVKGSVDKVAGKGLHDGKVAPGEDDHGGRGIGRRREEREARVFSDGGEGVEPVDGDVGLLEAPYVDLK